MQNKLCDISCIYQHIGQYTYCEQYSKLVAGSQFLGGGGALQKECNRGVGMILTFVPAASFPFQLRKIGIERNVLLHCKSIILVLNFVISLSYFSIELTLYLDRLI